MSNIKACINGQCLHNTCKRLRENPITEADDKLAKRLIAEGWLSISNKYHIIARWKVPPPAAVEMLVPEQASTFHGKAMIEMWERHRQCGSSLRMAFRDKNVVEEMTLTTNQYIAFRTAGGRSA